MPQSLVGFCVIVSQVAQFQLAGIGWHGIALGLWACLLFIAWPNLKRVANSNQKLQGHRLLAGAFSFGVVSQLLVLIRELGWIELISFPSILPTVEFGFHIVAMLLFAAGFIALTTHRKTAARPVRIKIGLALVCCVAAIWWWGQGLFVLAIALLGCAYIRNMFNEIAKESQQQTMWKERFEAFMDNSPFIAWVKNSAGEHQYLSQPYALQIGVPIEDWQGKTDYDLWPKEIAKSHIEMDKVALESGNTIVFESDHPLPSGEVKNWYVVKFPFQVGGDGQVFIGGIGLDVTDKKQAEQDRDRFFENSSELMCIADQDMKFRRVNRAFTDILGYSREELTGKSFRELVHPDDRTTVDSAFRRAHPDAKLIRFEIRFRCKNGAYRIVSWTSPISDNEMDRETVFAVGRDVTEKRTLERRLLLIADEEQKRIAHDLHDGLGQELTGLAMMAESLTIDLQQKNLPESDLSNKIAIQLDSSLQLTRSLARGLRPVEVDSHGLKSALSSLADRTDQRHKFQCTFSSTGDVESLDSDSATQLYRIAQEAVTNAARHAYPETVEICLTESNRMVELKIIDDGVGISELNEMQTGIGMMSMQYRSDVIGGDLRVESGSPAGTIVACSLAL